MTSNIDLVEYAGGGPFTFHHEGEIHTLPDPRTLHFQEVLEWLREGHVASVPSMPEWKRRKVFDRWAAHYGLPDFASAQRLTYVIDHYRSALVYDLAHFCPGADLGALWRERRWRELLDIVDHLPSHSWTAAAMANDPEHAKMAAESIAARKDEGEKATSSPPLQTWTPEVAALTTLTDAVNRVAYNVAAANSDPKKRPKPPEPMPRPETELEKKIKVARHEARKRRHEALADRLLGRK